MWADFLSPFFSLNENRFIYGWFFSLQFVFGTCTYDYLACITWLSFFFHQHWAIQKSCKKVTRNRLEACWVLLVASSTRQAILCLVRLVWLEKLKFVEVCTPMDHWTALNCKVGTLLSRLVPVDFAVTWKIFWGKPNLHKKVIAWNIKL